MRLLGESVMSSFNTVLVASIRMCLSKCSFVIMSHNIIFTFFLLPKIFPTFFFQLTKKYYLTGWRAKIISWKREKDSQLSKCSSLGESKLLNVSFCRYSARFHLFCTTPLQHPQEGIPTVPLQRGGGFRKSRADEYFFVPLF